MKYSGVVLYDLNSMFRSFFEKVLCLPYDSDHENQIKSTLLSKGFVEYNRKNKKDSPPEDGCWFIQHPNGKQKSPDFYVYHGKVRISVECKSSRSAFPTYNGGLPSSDVVYIFTSGKYNKTTIFFGGDIISEEDRKTLIEASERAKTASMIPALGSRGFTYYVRHMWIQQGGGIKTDYFKHPDRKRCEDNVLDYQW